MHKQVRAIGAIGVGLAGVWAWPVPGAWADEPLSAVWGNTAAACLETGTNAPEAHTGTVLLSLLLVLALLALLAWWLKRWPMPGKISRIEPKPGQLRMLNRFNAVQTFMLWEEAGKAYALIMKNNRVEMLAELPGVRWETGERLPRGGASAPKTFQDIWLNLIKTARKH